MRKLLCYNLVKRYNLLFPINKVLGRITMANIFKRKNTDAKNNEKELLRGPLQKRYLMLTLISTMFICIIISALSYYIFRNYLSDSLLNSTASSLANLDEAINTEINSVYRMARYCQSSSNLADYVKASPNPGSVLSVNTYDRLYEEYQNNEANQYIPRVVIIADKHFLQACQTSYSTTKDLAIEVPKLPFFADLALSKGYNFDIGIINDPFIDRLKKPVIPMIRPITYQFNSKQGGFMYLEIHTNLFIDQMKKYYMDAGSNLYLVMGEHIYKYEDLSLNEVTLNTSLMENANSYSINDNMTVFTGKYNHQKLTMIATPLKMDGCYLVQEVSPTMLQNQLKLFYLVLAGIIIIVLAMGFVLIMYSNKYFLRPLFKIRQKINETAAGDFSRDPSIEWNHELGEIGKGINDLSESIETLLETRLENEKQKRDLEYQMLQSQINPHFLYNTLNSIKMMASIQGANGIAEMTTALASLLRNISKGDGLIIPISEELSLVKDYFTIQNYRYGGMINFNIQIDEPDIVENSIIKFTLQPLVENSIFHGLEPKGGIGNITIHLSYIESDISIEVIDDGVGIPKDKLDNIFTGTRKDKNEFFKEIGISNVNKRLQYEFGSNYGISVRSTEGEGTTMQVRIPGRKNNV